MDGQVTKRYLGAAQCAQIVRLAPAGPPARGVAAVDVARELVQDDGQRQQPLARAAPPPEPPRLRACEQPAEALGDGGVRRTLLR
jgi:hypothetical protein